MLKETWKDTCVRGIGLAGKGLIYFILSPILLMGWVIGKLFPDKEVDF